MTVLEEEDGKACVQYLVKWRAMYNRNMYLVVTASNGAWGDMDDIAVENAVTAGVVPPALGGRAGGEIPE